MPLRGEGFEESKQCRKLNCLSQTDLVGFNSRVRCGVLLRNLIFLRISQIRFELLPLMRKKATVQHRELFSRTLLSKFKEFRDVLDTIKCPAFFHLEIQVRVIVP